MINWGSISLFFYLLFRLIQVVNNPKRNVNLFFSSCVLELKEISLWFGVWSLCFWKKLIQKKQDFKPIL